ncbi:MAG: hypothetical protein ABSH34_37305 [Verrucomicrobiota bacterium]
MPVRSLFGHPHARDSPETFLDDFRSVTREQGPGAIGLAGHQLLDEAPAR